MDSLASQPPPPQSSPLQSPEPQCVDDVEETSKHLSSALRDTLQNSEFGRLLKAVALLCSTRSTPSRFCIEDRSWIQRGAMTLTTYLYPKP